MKKSKLPKGMIKEQTFTEMLKEVKKYDKKLKEKRRRNLIKVLLFI